MGNVVSVTFIKKPNKAIPIDPAFFAKKVDPIAINVKGNKPANKLLKSISKKVLPFREKEQWLTRARLDRILMDEGLEPAKDWDTVGSTKEEIEYRQRQVHRLLLRGIPKKAIADYIGYSFPQLYKDIQDIEQKLKHGIAAMDYPLFVAQTLAFFDEARNVAMRFSSEQVSMAYRLQALRVAIEAEEAKHRYLHLAGLYRAANPITPATQQQDDKDFDKFLEVFTGESKEISTDATDS